jgi:large subunit ribosomal protein L18
MKQKKLQKNRERRAQRVHYKVQMTAGGKPRVVVFKSLNHIYVQMINDATHATIAASSTLTIQNNQIDKTAAARLVGIDLAEKAKHAGITQACFDRGRFLYHGRVKSVVEGLREGGLQI